MTPILLGSLADRHHILVRHQDDRGEGGVAALPSIDKAIVEHDFARHGRMGGRIGAGQPIMQPRPLFALIIGWVLVRDGWDLDRLRQVLGR